MSAGASIVGAGMMFRGDFAGDGELVVHGKVVGRIDMGHLVVARGGAVEGDIDVNAAKISGATLGSLRARSLALSATAKVAGEIEYDTMEVATGATVEGQSRRIAAIEIGRLLREGRSALGLSAADIAQGLRIRRQYVDALEAGRFGELPGDVYLPAFVRSYANYVGLAPSKILEDYCGEAALAVERPVALPAAPPRRRLAAPLGVVTLGTILVAAAYVVLNHLLTV